MSTMTSRKGPLLRRMQLIINVVLVSPLITAPIVCALLVLPKTSSRTSSLHARSRQGDTRVRHRCSRADTGLSLRHGLDYPVTIGFCQAFSENEVGDTNAPSVFMETPHSRAESLAGILATIMSSSAVFAGISKARADNLGVVDDLLADCPSTPTCVSSQDDRPYPFMEPWSYDGSWERTMKRLRTYLEIGGAKVVASSERYLRVEFDAKQAFPPSIDDAEFYFTPGDSLIQFRCARRSGPTDFGANRKRMDTIRVALNLESVPVLRNRKRVLVFGESPFDTFGPTFGNVDPSVIYGDADPMSPSFETPSRALREHVESGVGRSPDRPEWWGKPLAEAAGFADWEPTPWKAEDARGWS